jgi:hypothetical protein
VIIHELSDSASSHGPIVVSEVVVETFSPRFTKHNQLQAHQKSSAAAHYQPQPSSSFSNAANPFSNMLFAPPSSGLFQGSSFENSTFVSSSSPTFMASASSADVGSKDISTLHEKVRGILPIEQPMVWSNSGPFGFPREERFSMKSAELEDSLQQVHLGLFSRATQNSNVSALQNSVDSAIYSAENLSMWNAFPDASRVLPSDPKNLGSSW